MYVYVYKYVSDATCILIHIYIDCRVPHIVLLVYTYIYGSAYVSIRSQHTSAYVYIDSGVPQIVVYGAYVVVYGVYTRMYMYRYLYA